MSHTAKSTKDKLMDAIASPLMRGLGAFGSAELANRSVRLVTTVIIARQLVPEIVGQAALTLTLFEIVRVFTGIGVGQRIIACEEHTLAATCNTAHRLFWYWSFALVGVQLGVAAALGFGFGETLAAWMLATLALVHPMMPGGLVQFHLAMREGLNVRLARTAASQAIADHLLTAALLLIWPSPWSVVLPKLLTTPIWLAMSRRNRPWYPAPMAGLMPLGSMLRFGGGVLVADGLTALRTQGDNLIVGAAMGTSALGSYYFAYNAGLGIVSALVGAFGTVSFPLLCVSSPVDRARTLRRIVRAGLGLFIPFVALQALLAPFYVPIVFGDHWTFAAPLIAVLCLGGLAHLVSTITSNWLRSQGKIASDARRSLAVCIAALFGLYAGTTTGSLMGAVIGLIAGQSLIAFLFAVIALYPVFADRMRPMPFKEKLT